MNILINTKLLQGGHTLGEMLEYLYDERKDPNHDNWAPYPSTYIHIPGITYWDHPNTIQLLATEMQQVVNGYLKEEGSNTRIRTKMLKMPPNVSGGRPVYDIGYKLDHTAYTGEETNDLLDI